MLFASSRDALRKVLVDIWAEVQGTEFDDITYEEVPEKVRKIR